MVKLLKMMRENQERLLTDWLNGLKAIAQRRDLISDVEVREQARKILTLISNPPPDTVLEDFSSEGWQTVRDQLMAISISRVAHGSSPSETAQFLFSLKPPMFKLIREQLTTTPDELFREIDVTNNFIDAMALHIAESYIESRDKVIARQQEEMLELSTPVVTLWDGILALPVIGTLDSTRAQMVMESLLQAIVQTNSRFAILDITGVPTVDTLVAQHLLKTITAARLMGAECILSGIRPQIAQTIVHLGINLNDIVTRSKLADAFRLALDRSGRTVTQKPGNHTPVTAPAAGVS
ncbi:STAS domain-containing protein [Terriglobus albidus]|uniref:STAS domain-containing protein n=1 Tax=Terriglobus albidus TaxID=1592106 RepID=UPI0021E03F0F|nr:STAS domain-containing protein [Terriglobus albidus]